MEQTNTHPFLAKFYANPKKYTIETELGFVLLHYHQLNHLEPIPTITDFSPAKDLVFAKMNLAGEDLKLFEHVYGQLVGRLTKPRLAVFLDPPVDVLMQRMLNRARPYELSVPEDYIARLRQFYGTHMPELAEEVCVVEVRAEDSIAGVTAKTLDVIKQHIKC